ncbi:MAG: fasciclin domain-containing protein [Flavobacteriales bacterium]
MKLTLFHMFFTVGVMLALTLTGCTSEENKEPDPAPTAKMSPAARERMEQREEDVLKKQSMSKDEVENNLSPYRYVVSTKLHSIFGQLVKQSTLAKQIHGQGVTLLAPTDKAMEAMGEWKLLTRQEYRAELDQFVGHHVLPSNLTYEKFKAKDSHKCLAGETLPVNVRGGITINDARVRSGDVITSNGTVLALDDVVMTPAFLR